MKNNFRIFFIALTLLIYCFAVGYYFEYQEYIGSVNSETQIKEASPFSSELFCLRFQSKTTANGNINFLAIQKFKNQFVESGIISQDFESIIRADISNYLSFSRSILINHRKFDIIFPFDYFW